MPTMTFSSRGWRLGAVLALSLSLTACEDALLDFTDPDIIPTIGSAGGAIALRNGVVLRLQEATTGEQQDDSIFQYGGLLADEWTSGDTFEQRNTADQRTILETNTFLDEPIRDLNRVRVEGQAAIDALRQYVPTPTSNIGLMFALSGFATNQLGETFCNGMTLSSLDGQNIVYGGPIAVDSAFKVAAALADSALLYTGGTDGPTVERLARLVKARALLNRAQFADAAAVVASVPTDFAYDIGHSASTNDNQNWGLNTSAARYVVADRDGGNGLPYISANDPRVPVTNGGRKAFDTTTDFFFQAKWQRWDPITIASGVEARLIEAEAALRAGQTQTWLDKLNALRATVTGLDPLTDPGTAAAREDLHFYERGFWMFGTGHRLGDMRRLVRQYGRGAESVFPSGAYRKGGNYGTDVNMPYSFEERQNLSYAGCTDRNA